MANQGLAPRGPAPPTCRRAGGRIRQTPALGGRTRVPPCSPALAMCDPSYSSSALFPRLGNGVTGPHSGSPRDRRCWGGRSTPPGTGGGLGTVWHTYHCGVLGSHPACLREAVTCPDLGSGAPRGAAGAGGRGPWGRAAPVHTVDSSAASAASGPARAWVNRGLPHRHACGADPEEARQQRPAVCGVSRAGRCHSASRSRCLALHPSPLPPSPPWGTRAVQGCWLVSRLHSVADTQGHPRQGS